MADTIFGAFGEGAASALKGKEAAEAYHDIEAEKSTLKDAYSAGTEEVKGGEDGTVVKAPDMFKVNSIAAQMAASRGETRLADKYTKQAQDYKKSELANQSAEITVQQEKLGKLEQDLQMVNTPEELENMILKSDMPTNQKMQYIDAARKQGVAQFKETIGKASQTHQQRLEAQQKEIDEQRKKYEFEEKQKLDWAKLREETAYRDEVRKSREFQQAQTRVDSLRKEQEALEKNHEAAVHSIQQEGKKSSPEDKEKRINKLTTQHELALRDIEIERKRANDYLQGKSKTYGGESKDSGKYSVDDLTNTQRDYIINNANNPKVREEAEKKLGKDAVDKLIKEGNTPPKSDKPKDAEWKFESKDSSGEPFNIAKAYQSDPSRKTREAKQAKLQELNDKLSRAVTSLQQRNIRQQIKELQESK